MKLTHILALIGLAAIAQYFGLFSKWGIDLSKLKPQSPIASDSNPETTENQCPYSYSEVLIFTLNEVGATLPPECLKRDGGEI
ncbi:hypothetical protein NG799_21860 [Laspinema sp. D1]|uniref:Uncharacterized protein n=1 Tax=Laspinema palackyanum D2a TaxID=2953684 RepID=A0ABT2MZS0_9CYAN|nr:hypothetical protein [Laspinema sp. D2a]